MLTPIIWHLFRSRSQCIRRWRRQLLCWRQRRCGISSMRRAPRWSSRRRAAACFPRFRCESAASIRMPPTSAWWTSCQWTINVIATRFTSNYWVNRVPPRSISPHLIWSRLCLLQLVLGGRWQSGCHIAAENSRASRLTGGGRQLDEANCVLRQAEADQQSAGWERSCKYGHLIGS